MKRALTIMLAAVSVAVGLTTLHQSTANAAAAPARMTFLAATCPASSSMYSRVANGQDPTSNENGSAADPSDIAAYGCAQSSGLGLFLLANSTADSVFLDEALTQPMTVSSSEAGTAGAATVIQSGTTVFVPADTSQIRRFSVSNYPSTIVTRAAMPFLDLQCAGDGVNNDNADGAGWDGGPFSAGSQVYCIAYVWDGVPAATSTPTPAATATLAPSPTPTSGNVSVQVNFPGLGSVHTYVQKSDGVAGAANGSQVASATWKSDGATLTVAKGTYDIRVVDGPRTVVFDNVDCSSNCTVDVPTATLSVSFPGLTSTHVYAHVSDGAAGTYGAEFANSTWKDNSTSLTVLRGIYDVRIVHGPTTVVLDNIDCSGATCSAAAPLATLSVSFPGLTSAHTYVHVSDGLPGTYGAQDSSSTWKDNQTSLVILQGVYDVRVVHGPTSVVLDNVDCRATTCSVNVPLATLSVYFPGLTSAHTYVHVSDGVPGTYGAQDSSSTWKDNQTSLVILQGVYDVRVVHGPAEFVLDNIDCRAATCSATVPLTTLSVSFPGLTSVHTYVHLSDGAAGTYGAQDSSSTWKDNGTQLTLLQAVYDVRVVHGPTQVVFDNIDCRSATCSVVVPLAQLTVNFPGLTSAHTYVEATDGQPGTYGADDSSSTWKDNSTQLTLLQAVYDVRVVHGPMKTVIDNVDCRAASCVVDIPLAQLTVNFAGHSSVHSYVRADDGNPNSASGSEDSSQTWKNNSASFVLLRGLYDVLMVEGSKQYISDAVDCRAATCSTSMPSTSVATTPTATPTTAPTATPTTPAPAAATTAKVTKTFVSEDGVYVKWKLAPTAGVRMQVWDPVAVRCEAFNGASCKDLLTGGAAAFFTAGGTNQYLYVYQPLKKDGESCNVSNTAEWALGENPAAARESVTASYVCSGAPTMGWPLFALFVAATGSMAWVARRKFQWSR